jgi:UrcA family protein
VSLKIATGLLIVVSAAMAAEAQAQAAGHSAAPSRVVKFGDLDLATPAGTQELKARIGRAATQVCREAIRTRQDVFFDSCYALTMEHAITKLNRQILTAAHKGQPIRIVERR